MSGILGVLDLEGRGVERQMLAKLARGFSTRTPGQAVSGAEGGFGWAAVSLSGRLRPGQAIAGPRRGHWVLADARIDARDDLGAAMGNELDAAVTALEDADLLLRLYAANRLDGPRELLTRLVGEFVFAGFDRESRTLLVARDLFGQRPCFYAEIDGALWFTNTLACLHQHPRIDAVADEESIAAFLVTGENPRLEASFCRGVRRLPPGHALQASRAGVRLRRFADLGDGAKTPRREAEVIEGFLDVLRSAVEDRLRRKSASVFMSGGLDSTSVAATAHSLCKDAQARVLAVTGTYERLLPDQEGRYARKVAEHLGLHHEILASDGVELYESWDRPRPRPMQPIIDALCLGEPMLRRASDHARVALTGLGGDPLLQADPFHLAYQLRRGHLLRAARDALHTLRLRQRLPPTGLCTAWRRRRTDPLPGYPAWLHPELERRLRLRERYAVWQQRGRWEEAPFARSHGRSPARLGLGASTWTNVFESFDPGATGLPLRVTHPFFDLRVIRFVLGLPPHPWCVEKTLLRVAMRGRLPDAVLVRPKSPLAAYPRHAFPEHRRRRIAALLRITPGLEDFVQVERVARLLAAGDRVAPSLLDATFPVVALADWLHSPMEETRPKRPAPAVHKKRSAAHGHALF
jgi:asparagine synthase (glutamine-hydrolysing)